ncbi:Heterokaryon incompatibility protein (HET) domain containing protein [Rhypophila sp. PSN 637]
MEPRILSLQLSIEANNLHLHSHSHGNKANQSQSSQATLASQWLRDCILNHPLCKHTNFTVASPPLPPRVIDVLGRPEPYLLETGSVPGIYATLSYCWGSFRDPRMTTYGPRSKGRRGQPDPIPNIESHKRAIPFASMPSTLQDSVTFCRQIGIRYLWIDAFCIVQGDPDEWRDLNPRMADMYANAAFTIFADCAGGLEKGFLDNQDRMIRQQVDLSKSPLLLDEPLNDRAWAFSEAVFSNRAVHFTERAGIVWECNQVRRSQDGRGFAIECTGSVSKGNGEDYGSLRIFRNLDLAVRETRNVEGLYRRWDTVVEHFTHRYKDDQRLVALHRVTTRFAAILQNGFGVKDTYLAGIWKGDLPSGLLWSVEQQGTGAGPGSDECQRQGRWRRASIARAPSWSWASIEGPVSVQRHHGLHVGDGFQSGLLEIAHASTVCVGHKEPFSQVRSGRLVVRAMVVHGLAGTAIGSRELRKEDPIAGLRCRVGIPGVKGRGLAFVCDVPIQKIGGVDEVSCLYMGKGRFDMAGRRRKDGSRHVFLLLRSVALRRGHGQVYERIGISALDASGDDFDGIFNMLKEDYVEVI